VTLSVWAPDGAPGVGEGDALAAMLVVLVGSGGLEAGDVVVVTSKVVAKSEGRVRAGDRAEAIAEETVRVVARRGGTAIVRTRHGLTMAAAGVDASNVEPGQVVLLPVDPDASARRIRARLHQLTGRVVGVVVTDTAGRAWREGQTDIAVGAAGLLVTQSFAGQVDGYGNPLAVTAPAVADEIAGAAELVQGKLGGRPFAVVRGRADLVLPAGEEGPGAVALIRPDGTDMFGYGAREAVMHALDQDGDPGAFGAPMPAAELRELLDTWIRTWVQVQGDEILVEDVEGPRQLAVVVAAYAHGWEVASRNDSSVRLRPSGPFT
jgi:coenzyme F420-0:L-glutamate ligase/coenzyme F420-1:gamma-L-glutamate ligase